MEGSAAHRPLRRADIGRQGALGAYLGSGGDALVAISLALAAGAMLYVTYCEILPQVILLNQERGPAVFTIMGIILGLLMVHAL